MRRYSSFFIILTSKDSKKSFKSQYWIWMAFLSTLLYHGSIPPPPLLERVLSIRTPPLPPPISNRFFLYSIDLPPLVGIGPTMIMTIVVVVHHPSPPHLQTWRAVMVWSTKRRYLYPITLANTVHGIESSPRYFRKNIYGDWGWGWVHF